jgi:signal transduction histidine kinase
MIGQTIHVLLIDDDEDCFVLTRDMLSRSQDPAFEIEWVDTYAAGRAALEQKRHDVCLLDYRLGPRDGLDLLRETIAAGCAIPIVLLTAMGGQAIDRQAQAAGAADYLDKNHLERGLLERALRYAVERHRHREAIQRKNRELEQFVYTASHDLKSPLLAFNGYLHYIEQDMVAGSTEHLPDYIATLKQASQRMRRTLDDLLELSRAGRTIKHPTRVSLDRLIAHLRCVYETRLAARGITLRVDDDLPEVTADPTRLMQVLDNLVGNAIKYGCGEVGGLIEIGCEETGGECRIYVRDHGPGIDPKHQEKIFELFHRLDTRVEGTGLGLAIVRSIAAAHGGRAWVQSQPGQGATFHLALPQRVRTPTARAA